MFSRNLILLQIREIISLGMWIMLIFVMAATIIINCTAMGGVPIIHLRGKRSNFGTYRKEEIIVFLLI